MRTIILLVLGLACDPIGWADESPPLAVEAKIALGDIKGRIDHLAIDVTHQRLFVAQLGNNTVGVIDIAGRRVLRTMTGFDELQGLAYSQATDTLYVASGGDGTLKAFRGPELSPSGTLKLGSDADNVRIGQDGQVLVGYGSGAIALIDPASLERVADIRLKAHPESFQIDEAASRLFVNVPNAHEIAVLDRSTKQQITSWGTSIRFANYPMAIDAERSRVLVVYRHPASLAAYQMSDGATLATLATCGDADDVFVDPKRARVYVICGEGFMDVLATNEHGYSPLAQLKTISGARTGLYVPALDRLFVAARASAAAPASIWVMRTSK